MSISNTCHTCKYRDRPPNCRVCNRPAWWNGSRTVSSVHKRGETVEYLTGIIRRRARCSSKDCTQGSWTVYKDDDSYPHRLFQLLVVISAVISVIFEKKTMTAAGDECKCSRDSVRRWIEWVSRLADPKHLMHLCTRLDPDGLPGAFISNDMPRAGAVIHLLDRLATLLRQRGIKLPKVKSGLTSVLKDQLNRFGVVFYLTKLSPPLRGDLSGICL